MSDEGAALAFANVTKKYGAVPALSGVSFAIAPGEMFGVIGPDGAGKTTSIRLACGLIRADGGTVTVLGRDPVKSHRAMTSQVGYLSQRFSLYGDLTIDENIGFFAEIHGVKRYRATRDRLLDMTQLTPFRARRADRLSGGMKQKLALACTLVHEPKVLLLDEPTTGVDPVSRREFWKLLSEFLAGGLTVVMATPYLDEAERCSRIVLLHEGGVLAVDRPEHLQGALNQRILEVVTDTPRPPTEVLAAVAGVADVQPFGERAHLRLAGITPRDAERDVRAALAGAGIAVVSIRPVAASLEDVFIELVGRPAGGRKL
jgi:ABC-2 type transport system ATP-binding protein